MKPSNEKQTPEERLLSEIFKKEPSEDEYDENYPDTNSEKIGYALYALTKSLESISPALLRLRRLDSLYTVSKDGNELPAIIANNEAKMALKHLKHVQMSVNDAFEETMTVYRRTDRIYEKSEELKKEEAER